MSIKQNTKIYLLGYNKKINSTDLFKPNAQKIILLETEKYKLLDEIVKDYEELDSLKIKDTVFNYVTEETNYYDLFKLTTYNFNYFVELLKKQNSDITTEEILAKLDELQKYIYDNYVDIIDNIRIIENKELDKVVCDKYKLNDLIVNHDNLTLDQIDKYIVSVDKAILFYDIDRLNINLEGIKFILDTDDIFKKID